MEMYYPVPLLFKEGVKPRGGHAPLRGSGVVRDCVPDRHKSCVIPIELSSTNPAELGDHRKQRRDLEAKDSGSFLD